MRLTNPKCFAFLLTSHTPYERLYNFLEKDRKKDEKISNAMGDGSWQ